MRVLPVTAAAFGCALTLAACARVHVERGAAPPRPATVQTVPGATVITPGGAPPAAVIAR
jgi:hypothetical protein